MTTYSTIITNNGKAMFASAATSSGRVNITHLAVGDGNGSVPTPKANQTRLIKEAHRVTVNSVEKHATNANWIEIGAIIPSSSGGYTVREIGLYAGNTLIAVGSFPATYKPTASEGGAREMSIRIIIAVENAAVVNVTLDNSLVYATRQWVESNFVNHNEVIDNLTSIDADKPLSANQGKVLKDGLDGLTTSKADKTTNLTAGNGLTGGGNLSASRTVALGTPSQITATSTNGVTTTSHTHAIDKASTTVAGVVQLYDALDSTATNLAMTANQGKILNDKITATDAKADTKANQATAIVAGNGLTGGGTLQASRTVALGTPGQITASTTNSVKATSHTHAIDKASTSTQGIVQLVDNLTTDNATRALTARQGKILNDKITATDAKADTKANQATAIVAGNGLTGGGTLQASRTVALGTPGQITASTTNSVKATSHTHAIDKASTSTQGIVQLVDNLTTDNATRALTARQGKILNDKITATDAKADTKANQATAIVAGNGLTGGGTLQASRTVALGTPGQITASTTNSVTATSHTHAIDKASTSTQGIVQLVDNLTTDNATRALTARQGKVLDDSKFDKSGGELTGALTLTNTATSQPSNTVFAVHKQGLQGYANIYINANTDNPSSDEFVLLTAGKGLSTDKNDGLVVGNNYLKWQGNDVVTNVKGNIDLDTYCEPCFFTNRGDFSATRFPTRTGNDFGGIILGHSSDCTQIVSEAGKLFSRGSDANPISAETQWSDWEEVATTNSNVASATKLQTARTISLTGAVTGSVSFNGSGNVSLATTVQSVSNKVVVMTGVIDNGGTIPLPADFTESQCKWMVSINDDNPTSRTWDIWEGGRLRHYGFKCFTTGRVVTAQTYLDGHNGPPGWIPAKANYIVIGVK